jgi:hypothetical protein
MLGLSNLKSVLLMVWWSNNKSWSYIEKSGLMFSSLSPWRIVAWGLDLGAVVLTVVSLIWSVTVFAPCISKTGAC